MLAAYGVDRLHAEGITGKGQAGAAESVWENIGAQPHPSDRASTDRWLKPALERADAAEMKIATAEGRAMTIREAVKCALGLPQEPDHPS
jgi:hypothetical protein